MYAEAAIELPAGLKVSVGPSGYFLHGNSSIEASDAADYLKISDEIVANIGTGFRWSR
jgi:hypothetical protein